MASVYELARELGKELMNTPEVEQLLQAKKVYEADTEIVRLVKEYGEMQQDFETEVRQEPQNRDKLSEVYQLLKRKCWEVGLFGNG